VFGERLLLLLLLRRQTALAFKCAATHDIVSS
jgi:hypothetical protein